MPGFLSKRGQLLAAQGIRVSVFHGVQVLSIPPVKSETEILCFAAKVKEAGLTIFLCLPFSFSVFLCVTVGVCLSGYDWK